MSVLTMAKYFHKGHTNTWRVVHAANTTMNHYQMMTRLPHSSSRIEEQSYTIEKV